MDIYEVVENKVMAHPEKDYKVSIHGAHPGPGWRVVTQGYTVYNRRTGTYGVGRVPWQNREDAQKWADEQIND